MLAPCTLRRSGRPRPAPDPGAARRRRAASGAITAVVQEEFGISQPAVSQHLRVLRDSGFATVRPEGTRRLYAVDAAPLRELDAGSALPPFWEQRLDALETELARGKRERRLPAADPTAPEGDHPMIDVVREIEAVQREVGTGRIAAGEGHAGPAPAHLRRARSTTSGTRSPTPSASAAGSCPSAATSGSAAATSSRATPAARSSPASGRTGCWSPGSSATAPAPRTSPRSRSD